MGTKEDNYELVEASNKKSRERKKQLQKEKRVQQWQHFIGYGYNNHKLAFLYRFSLLLFMISLLWFFYHIYMILTNNILDFTGKQDDPVYGYWLLYTIVPPFFILIILLIFCEKLKDIDRSLY